jgi:hypothetical protein
LKSSDPETIVKTISRSASSAGESTIVAPIPRSVVDGDLDAGLEQAAGEAVSHSAGPHPAETPTPQRAVLHPHLLDFLQSAKFLQSIAPTL